MNKQISTKIGLLIILIIVAVVGIIFWMISKTNQNPVQLNIKIPVPTAANNQPVPTQNTKEQSCVSSGGTVGTSICCQSASDFPNSCAIGACGCAPANSHQVKTCECGAGKCFDGNSCVDEKLPANQANSSDVRIADWKTYRNNQLNYEINYPNSWKVVGPAKGDLNQAILLGPNPIFGEMIAEQNNKTYLEIHTGNLSATKTTPQEEIERFKKTRTDFVDSKSIMLSGESATEFSGSNDGSVAVLIPHKNELYYIFILDNSRNFSDVKKSLESFKFTK